MGGREKDVATPGVASHSVSVCCVSPRLSKYLSQTCGLPRCFGMQRLVSIPFVSTPRSLPLSHLRPLSHPPLFPLSPASPLLRRCAHTCHGQPLFYVRPLPFTAFRCFPLYYDCPFTVSSLEQDTQRVSWLRNPQAAGDARPGRRGRVVHGLELRRPLQEWSPGWCMVRRPVQG